MKDLVVYFSASGVTKKVAEKIKNVVNGDIFEIEPIDKYTDEDLDWRNKNSRSSVEMADKNSRPKVKNKVEDINKYDRVIIGFPVWWDLAPTVVNTFIEENDLSNKKIYVFVTSGGSEVDNSFNVLKDTYSDLNFVSGMRLYTSSSEDGIKGWLD